MAITKISDKKLAAIEKFKETLGTENTIKNLKLMKEIMNKSFGEDNNQILQPSVDSFRTQMMSLGKAANYLEIIPDDVISNQLLTQQIGYYITIKFPEITITNSRKLSHVIKDLYVSFTVGQDCKFLTSIYGVRGTITEEEFYSFYSHSHLPGINFSDIRFNHFCTGEGEINQVISLLSTKFDEINFTLFCLHLKNYVIWESLEGSPYKNLEFIEVDGGRNTRIGISRGLSDNQKTRVADVLKSAIFREDKDSQKLFNQMFGFNVTPNGIKVYAKEEFEEWAAEHIEKIKPASLERYAANNDWALSLKNSQGDYITINNSPSSRRTMSYQTTPIFKFKGEDISLKVIKEEYHEIKSTKYLNPDITQKLCLEFSRSFTKTALNSEGFEEQEDTIRSIPEVAEPDLFPL